MLISLIKKDFILVKKQMFFLLAFAIFIPMFLYSKSTDSIMDIVILPITAIFALFQINSSIYAIEEKYKGSVLLSTTPYTRGSLVKARYAFFIIVLALVVAINYIMAFIPMLSLPVPAYTALAIALLVSSVYLSALIPLQYKFGVDKTRYISFLVVFAMPFIAPYVAKIISKYNISINLPVSPIMQALVMIGLAVIFYIISMVVSIKIYSKKNF